MNSEYQNDPFPQVKQVLIIILATLMLTFIIGALCTILGVKTGLFLLEAIIIVPALIFVIKNKYPIITIFRLRPVSKNIVVISALIGIGFTVVTDEFDRLIQIFLPMPEILTQAMEESLRIDSTSDFIIILFSAVILASILEEMLFRGFVQTSFENNFDVTKAVMGTAFLFAVIHLNPWWTIQFTLFGIILGVMAWKSNSIIPPLIVHFINNGIALIFTNSAPESYNWYLYKNHVNIPILIIALILTVYGLKLFYYFCEIYEQEKKIDIIK